MKIDQITEKRIRKVLEHHMNETLNTTDESTSKFAAGVHIGVLKTLDILGIKIHTWNSFE